MRMPSTIAFLIFSVAGLQTATISSDGQDLKYRKFVTDATELPEIEEEYDFIVVGGGTAGCPLAATLSTHYSVLVLERGGDAQQHPNVLWKDEMLSNIIQTDGEDSPAESFTSEDGVANTRGRILGGSSMVNFGFYSRADPDFYASSGIDWDMDAVNRSYRWVEEIVVTHPDLDTTSADVRKALLEAGVLPDNGFTFDHLQGTKTGGSTFDNNGRRHGAADLLSKANPSNLRVALHATVQRLTIFSRSEPSDGVETRETHILTGPAGGLYAGGVIYSDSRGKLHRVGVRCGGEVILSAGALGSPQLLLLSGIGPRQYLSSMNITLVLHQPFVAQFMVDNPKSMLNFVRPSAISQGVTNPKVVGITSHNYIESFAAPTSFFSPDPPLPINGSTVAIESKFRRVLSSGNLSLASPTEAGVSPLVRFNYLSNQEDVVNCVHGVRILGKMMETPAFETYKFPDPLGSGKSFRYIGRPLPKDQSNDTAMGGFCRDTVNTFSHYHGGCVVGKVVDSGLKLIGVNALRVVDGSIFTVTPGTNPQATLMMMGRYVGLKIHEERTSAGLASKYKKEDL